MWLFNLGAKTVPHPAGHTVKLGRKRPVARCPRPALRTYLFSNLPEPPASVDYSGPAKDVLNKVYMNDTLSCCVISGPAHIEGVLVANSGRTPVPFTDEQIISLYSAIGGYKPGDEASDQGCDEQTMLNYWMTKGFGDGTLPIAGWLGVDKSNIKTCIWLLENLVLGVELPDAWVDPVPGGTGFVWDVAGPSNPENGHCFIAYGYNEQGILIDTWGYSGVMTWAALDKYVTGDLSGESYAVLSNDAISRVSARAPNGFDWQSLVSDFDMLR